MVFLPLVNYFVLPRRMTELEEGSGTEECDDEILAEIECAERYLELGSLPQLFIEN